MSSFLRRAVAPVAVAVALVGGATGCSRSQTTGPGSVETASSAPGDCIPSDQTFQLAGGDVLRYAIADMSHGSQMTLGGPEAHTKDYLKIEAVANPDEEVVEVAFTNNHDSETLLKPYGKQGTGVDFWQGWDIQVADVEAIADNARGYGFSIREGYEEGYATEINVSANQGNLTAVSVTLTQDCEWLPAIKTD